MRIMGLWIEWGWWNLYSWNKRMICHQRKTAEGLVHVDDGIETARRSRSSIDKKYYSPLYRDYLLYSARVFFWSDEKKNVQEEKKITMGTYNSQSGSRQSTSGTLVSQNQKYSSNDEHFAY
jgi:hypothetical protein